MQNDRGVYWQLNKLHPDNQAVEIKTFDNAETARKEARASRLPSEFIKLYKMDPVHGAVEIEW